RFRRADPPHAAPVEPAERSSALDDGSPDRTEARRIESSSARTSAPAALLRFDPVSDWPRAPPKTEDYGASLPERKLLSGNNVGRPGTERHLVDGRSAAGAGSG